MEKNISFGTITIALAVIALTVLHFTTDIDVIVIQQLLLSALMFLLAYNHAQKKERDITFWLLIIAGVCILIVQFVVVQPFF